MNIFLKEILGEGKHGRWSAVGHQYHVSFRIIENNVGQVEV